jgi:hypothetical protein
MSDYVNRTAADLPQNSSHNKQLSLSEELRNAVETRRRMESLDLIKQWIKLLDDYAIYLADYYRFHNPPSPLWPDPLSLKHYAYEQMPSVPLDEKSRIYDVLLDKTLDAFDYMDILLPGIYCSWNAPTETCAS